MTSSVCTSDSLKELLTYVEEELTKLSEAKGSCLKFTHKPGAFATSFTTNVMTPKGNYRDNLGLTVMHDEKKVVGTQIMTSFGYHLPVMDIIPRTPMNTAITFINNVKHLALRQGLMR